MKIYCLDSTYKNKNLVYLQEVDLLKVTSFEDSFFIFKEINFIISKFISMHNLIKYINYVESAVLKKKVILFYGNCHLNPIKEMCNKTNAFTNEYFIWPLLGICQIKDPSYFNHPAFSIFCNIFIDQEIQKNNAYGEEYSSEYILKNYINPNAKRIVIPNTYKLPLFLFPQCDISFYYCDGDRHLFFKDKILEEYYENHKRPMKGSSYFQKLKLLSVNFESNKINFIEKVKTREEKWDIKISEFLENNIDCSLYCDPHHPAFNYLYYIYKELMNFLKIKPEVFEKKQIVNLNLTEMPSIIDIDNYKKIYRDIGNNVPLSLKKYIKLYGAIKKNFDRNVDMKKTSYYRFLRLKCKIIRKLKRLFKGA